MRFKLFLVTLTFLLFSITAYSQYNYVQKLGNLGSINLPARPTLKQAKGIDIYFNNYNGLFYISQAGEIGNGLRSLFTKNNTDSIYTQYIRGTMAGTIGKVFYKGKIKINDHDAVEFGYKAKLNGQETYRYNRVIALNDTILMCGIWASDSVSKNSPYLVDFFKGFKTKSEEEISSANARKIGHKIGYSLGMIIILAIFAGIGLAVVLLIKKIAYRNKIK